MVVAIEVDEKGHQDKYEHEVEERENIIKKY